MKILKILMFSFIFVFPAIAHDHGLGSIKGQSIDLYERSHAFSGIILETPVFGAFEHQPFGATVSFRRHDKTVQFQYRPENGVYAGEILELNPKNQQPFKTAISLIRTVRVSDTEALIYLNLSGREVVTQIRSDSWNNNHFVNPVFSFVVDGETLSFAMTGEACMGYSTNIAMMVIGVYSHLRNHAAR